MFVIVFQGDLVIRKTMCMDFVMEIMSGFVIGEGGVGGGEIPLQPVIAVYTRI